MSINVTLQRITGHELADVLTLRTPIASVLGIDIIDDSLEFAFSKNLEDTGRILRIGRFWQAVHFIVTGENCSNNCSNLPSELSDYLMGGVALETDPNLEDVFYLTPDMVANTYAAVSEIPKQRVQQRVSFELFNREQIYPAGRHFAWEQEDVDEVVELHAKILEFYRLALECNNPVLRYVS